MYLRVNAQTGIVRISAPSYMPFDRIRQFASDNIAWVRKRRAAMPSKADPLLEQSVWGHSYPVRFVRSAQTCIELAKGEIVAGLPSLPDAELWQAMLNMWRKHLVEMAAPSLFDHWREVLGLGPVQWSVRVMKRRWGTCYPGKGKVLLNSQLAAKPPDCLAYVITHELLHFFFPNHGAEFRRALAGHWPNWREMDEILDGKTA